MLELEKALSNGWFNEDARWGSSCCFGIHAEGSHLRSFSHQPAFR